MITNAQHSTGSAAMGKVNSIPVRDSTVTEWEQIITAFFG